jgi:hypothetical protein
MFGVLDRIPIGARLPTSILRPLIMPFSDVSIQKYHPMSTDAAVDKGVRILSLGMHINYLQVPATTLMAPIKIVEVPEPTPSS